MGKGARPLYSIWNGEKLGYIEARKKIYIPLYAKNVIHTPAYSILKNKYKEYKNLILLDFDAYDHRKLGMSWNDVIECSSRKMGHSFILAMLLEEAIDI